jgi:hypothetical protein
VYQVALEYNGIVATRDVIFQPSDTVTKPPPPPSILNPKVPRSMYYAVYTYNAFINMINATLALAFADLVTPVGSVPPTIYFNASTNLFSLLVDPLFYAGDLPLPIYIYMNYKLFQFFVGFNVLRTGFMAADGRDFRFEIVINANVNGALLIMSQDYATFSNWNCLRTIQLRSPLMPTKNEFVPSTSSGSDSRSATAAILSSFTPAYGNSPGAAVPRSQVNFTLQSAWRLIEVVSSAPMTKISLAIYWSDEQNNSYPLILNYRELILCKLCFHRKDTYVG